MIFLITANILALLTLFLYILCIGLPYWVWVDPSAATSRIYYGLWELCVSINYDEYVCRSYGKGLRKKTKLCYIVYMRYHKFPDVGSINKVKLLYIRLYNKHV